MKFLLNLMVIRISRGGGGFLRLTPGWIPPISFLLLLLSLLLLFLYRSFFLPFFLPSLPLFWICTGREEGQVWGSFRGGRIFFLWEEPLYLLGSLCLFLSWGGFWVFTFGIYGKGCFCITGKVWGYFYFVGYDTYNFDVGFASGVLSMSLKGGGGKGYIRFQGWVFLK